MFYYKKMQAIITEEEKSEIMKILEKAMSDNRAFIVGVDNGDDTVESFKHGKKANVIRILYRMANSFPKENA